MANPIAALAEIRAERIRASTNKKLMSKIVPEREPKELLRLLHLQKASSSTNVGSTTSPGSLARTLQISATPKQRTIARPRVLKRGIKSGGSCERFCPQIRKGGSRHTMMSGTSGTVHATRPSRLPSSDREEAEPRLSRIARRCTLHPSNRSTDPKNRQRCKHRLWEPASWRFGKTPASNERVSISARQFQAPGFGGTADASGICPMLRTGRLDPAPDSKPR